MAVGDGAKAAVQSYVAMGKESTFGTYASATTAVEALSCTFKTERDSQKIESLGRNRGFSRRVFLDKKVSGSLEANLHPEESILLVATALGGGITSSGTSTSGYTHSLTAGNFDTSPSSLSFNHRKGDTHTFHYSGGRINSLKISANVGEPVKLSAEFIFKDSTQLSDDIASSLSISTVGVFTYVHGTFRYAATEANAATSTAAEPIQGFELTINNNLESEKGARQLGSEVLTILPSRRREVEFKITQRFDTTTALNRFLQATQGAVDLFFRGESIGSTSNFHECTIRLPKVFYNSGADPEVGGPGDIIMAEIPFDVLVDNPYTTTGKDIGITFQNATASY